MTDGLFYQCPNGDCPLEGMVVIIRPGESVDCPECDWSMSAVYDGGNP